MSLFGDRDDDRDASQDSDKEKWASEQRDNEARGWGSMPYDEWLESQTEQPLG